MIRSLSILPTIAMLLVSLFGARASAAPTRDPEASMASIYWGALIDARREGFENPPWDMRGVDAFEARAGKSVSILHIGFPWYNSVTWPGDDYYPFVPSLFETLHTRGIIPLVTWAPWDGDIASHSSEQPKFALSTIIRGDHDAYITKWATDARAWGHPFFMRFAWEMNGDWYPWSETRNGNASGEYAQAWRHVHDISSAAGATNVTWVWSAVTDYAGSSPLEGLYPGDAYVDWIGLDGYNWPSKGGWQSFSTVFKPTYEHVQRLAPSKPIILTEVASSEEGGSKAEWITDALSTQLPQYFPNINAVVWFNWNFEGEQWIIESSVAATTAFRKAISAPQYAPSSAANVSGQGKILPLNTRIQTTQPQGKAATDAASSAQIFLPVVNR